MKKSIIFLALLVSLSATARDRNYPRTYNPEPPPTKEYIACTMAGKLAHDTYLQVTFDAQRPDKVLLNRMLDWNSDLRHDGHDRAIAHNAINHIADRLKQFGVRRPWPEIVYEATRESMSECLTKGK